MNIELTEKDLQVIEFALRDVSYKLSGIMENYECQRNPFIAQNIQDIGNTYLKVTNKILNVREIENNGDS